MAIEHRTMAEFLEPSDLGLNFRQLNVRIQLLRYHLMVRVAKRRDHTLQMPPLLRVKRCKRVARLVRYVN